MSRWSVHHLTRSRGFLSTPWNCCLKKALYGVSHSFSTRGLSRYLPKISVVSTTVTSLSFSTSSVMSRRSFGEMTSSSRRAICGFFASSRNRCMTSWLPLHASWGMVCSYRWRMLSSWARRRLFSARCPGVTTGKVALTGGGTMSISVKGGSGLSSRTMVT